METIWKHTLFLVTTDKLFKYLEITAYDNNTISFKYISKNIVEFIEKEQTFNFDPNTLGKFKKIITNFPKLEVLYLDIDQLFIFMKTLLEN
jgi:hypothetical protein